MGRDLLVKEKLKSLQWLRNIKGKSYPFWRLDNLISEKIYEH